MTLQAFALLSALAALSSVAGAARASQLGFVAAGMLASAVLMLPALFGLPLAPLLNVEPTQIALLLALFALGKLRGNVGQRMSLVVGGALAVVWLQALRATGWPLLAALPLVLVAIGLAAVLGMTRHFLPRALQDDVALVLLAGGLAVALLPGILEGWDSAQALKGSAEAAEAAGKDVLWIAAGFVVLGAGFAWWKTNRRWNR